MIDPHAATQLWADTFGLDDWAITFRDQKPSEGLMSQVVYDPSFKVARIEANTSNLNDAELVGSILHEIVHLALKPYTQIVQRLAANTESPMREFVLGQMEDAEEQVVEAIVRSHGFPRYNPLAVPKTVIVPLGAYPDHADMSVDEPRDCDGCLDASHYDPFGEQHYDGSYDCGCSDDTCACDC